MIRLWLTYAAVALFVLTGLAVVVLERERRTRLRIVFREHEHA